MGAGGRSRKIQVQWHKAETGSKESESGCNCELVKCQTVEETAPQVGEGRALEEPPGRGSQVESLL